MKQHQKPSAQRVSSPKGNAHSTRQDAAQTAVMAAPLLQFHGDPERQPEWEGGGEEVNSIRFKDDASLDKVEKGALELKKGDTGIHVTKVQQALADKGFLDASKVSGIFDADTQTAVTAFQTSLFPVLVSKVNGIVDKPTLWALDFFIKGYDTEKKILEKQGAPKKKDFAEYAPGSAPPELLKGTRTLNDKDRKGVADAISTEVKANPVTGKLPTFKVKDKAQYKKDVKAKALEIVQDQYNRLGKGKAKDHKDKSKLMDWSHLVKIAKKSKEATDGLFGSYRVGPEFKKGVNLFDGWDFKVKQLKDPKKADDSAIWRVQKIVQGDGEIGTIDTKYGAVQSREPEKTLVWEVINEIAKAKRTELLETHKGWPGFAFDGKVFLQLFKESDKSRMRAKMWRLFITCIHEYIHTLEHSKHKKYSHSLGEKKGGKVLREGVTDYFTKIVVNQVNAQDPALAKIVEKDVWSGAPGEGIDLRKYGGYPESQNAEKMAGIVGFRNIAAAFFLGQVELIGKK